MIVPSAMNMKFKFPAFRGLDDGEIEFAIEEAVVACGNGEWIDEANQTLGIQYYAAHLLRVAMLRAGSGTGQILASERIGELSLNYAVPDQNKAIDFTMTEYGEKFIGLIRKNFPGVLVVNSAIRM